MQEKTVEICRELAMSIWKKTYGKATKAKDFAGREMDKGAYDQRGSKFGWNLDHILPKSRGGKDTESNLICCHIITNDEKADKFPCFTANGKQFEIIKVENHYEIKEKKDDSSKDNSDTDSKQTQDLGVNFYDYSAGIRCYQTYAKQFWGSLTIELENPQNAAIVDFIKELFDEATVVARRRNNYDGSILIRVAEIRLPTKESIQELRNKSLTLNTYLGAYFLKKKLISNYYVFCEAHDQKDELKCIDSPNTFNSSYKFTINELIKINSDADGKLTKSDCVGRDDLGYRVYQHDWFWTKLKENLEKN